MQPLVVVQVIRVQERSAERAVRARVFSARPVPQLAQVPVVHLVEPVVVLVPVPPPLHHRAEGVERPRALRRHQNSLFDGALARLARAAAVGLLARRAFFCRPSRFFRLVDGLAVPIRRLLGGFQARDALHRARAAVFQQQVLNRRRMIALDFHLVVADGVSSASQTRLQQTNELFLVALDVADDCHGLTPRALLRSHRHSALLRAPHLEHHRAGGMSLHARPHLPTRGHAAQGRLPGRVSLSSFSETFFSFSRHESSATRFSCRIGSWLSWLQVLWTLRKPSVRSLFL